MDSITSPASSYNFFIPSAHICLNTQSLPMFDSMKLYKRGQVGQSRRNVTRRHTRRHTHGETHTERHTRRDTHGETHTERHTHTHTHTHTPTHPHTPTPPVFLLVYRLVESIYLLCLAVSRLKGV